MISGESAERREGERSDEIQKRAVGMKNVFKESTEVKQRKKERERVDEILTGRERESMKWRER